MKSNRPVAYSLIACALVLAWLAAFLLGTGDVDLALLQALYSGDRPILADSARLITLLGGWYFVTPFAVVVALIVAVRGRVWLGLVLFVGTSVGRLLVEYQKYELGRLRPNEHPHLVTVHNLSFPIDCSQSRDLRSRLPPDCGKVCRGPSSGNSLPRAERWTLRLVATDSAVQPCSRAAVQPCRRGAAMARSNRH